MVQSNSPILGGFRTLQFENEFLAQVRVQTSIALLTATGLVVYLFMQIFGVKPRPVAINRSTLIQTHTQVMGYEC